MLQTSVDSQHERWVEWPSGFEAKYFPSPPPSLPPFPGLASPTPPFWSRVRSYPLPTFVFYMVQSPVYMHT